MNINEKLAVITALEKWVKEAKENIRSQADAEFADLCEAYNVERQTLTLNGQKVGTYTMEFNKEHFVVVDKIAWEDFASAYGIGVMRKKIRPGMMGSAIAIIEGAVEPESINDYIVEEFEVDPDWESYLVNVGGKVVFQDSGMEVPGVAFVPRAMNRPKVYGCKPADVVPILRSLPGGIETLLLGGE